MKVAVIGSGAVGGALADRARSVGLDVNVGSRSGTGMSVGDAIGWGEVVMLAIPGGAVPELAQTYAEQLAGRVVIDATNNIGQGGPISGVGALVAAAPTAHVFRAFNSVGWENMIVDDYDGVRPDLFFAGPDDSARPTVEGLISDLGPRPVYVGATAQAHAAVDALTGLWFSLAFDRQHGRRIAFKLLGA